MNDDQVLGMFALLVFQFLCGVGALLGHISGGWPWAVGTWLVLELVFLSMFTYMMVGVSNHGRGPYKCWKYLCTGR